MLAGLQRFGGNRAVQRLLGADGPGPVRVQRAPGDEEESAEGGAAGGGSTELMPNPYEGPTIARPDLTANPYTGESDPVELTNERFSGISGLAPIAAGERTLSARDNGPAVKAVQQALLDLGYELLRFQHDGHFGNESAAAISLFREDRGMGPGELTAKALGELDQLAPAPGIRREHFPDYERLFADGKLEVTIAIGYDEEGSHKKVVEEAHTGLQSRGFKAEAPEEGKPADRYKARKTVTYPTSDGGRTTKEIEVVVGVIAPGEGAAQRFGRALSESELTIYAGHARRGIGPDFDADKSPKENFVIGVNSALHAAGKATSPSKVEQHHYVIDKVNDLEKMTLQARRAGSVRSVTTEAITIDAEAGGVDVYPLTRATAESGGAVPAATTTPTGAAAAPTGATPSSAGAAAEGAAGGETAAAATGAAVPLHAVVKAGDVVKDKQAIAQEFDPEKYRVWFFDACTSLAYMDEIRGALVPSGAERENLDVFGTRKSVPWAVGLAADWALLDGILASETTEQIVAQMVKLGEDRIRSLNATDAKKQRAIRQLQDAYWREGAATGRVAEGTP